jgi:hypothetical protein
VGVEFEVEVEGVVEGVVAVVDDDSLGATIQDDVFVSQEQLDI